MGKQIAEEYPEARQVFEQADEALGIGLSELCFGSDGGELRLTENTQPAILATSVALLRVLERQGQTAQYVAGHSLGEYSALVAAGAVRYQDAVKLVHCRGRFMQEAVADGVGAMSAVLGLDLADVEQVCQEAAQGEVVSPANVNSPNQIVIAGHVQAVGRAAILAKKKGAKRVLRLSVSAPFHCQLMKPAEVRLSRLLRQIPFCDLRVPLVNNVEAQVIREAGLVREGLTKQVSSAVLWSDCVQQLLRLGVSTFVEVGPGKVLSGLVRRMAPPTARVFSIENGEQLRDYVRLQ